MRTTRRHDRVPTWPPLTAVILVAVWPATTAAGGPGATVVNEEARDTVSERRLAVHLLQRATFGVRPGDVERVLDMGVDAWLDEQLHPDRVDDSDLELRLATYPTASMSQRELYEAFPPPQVLRERFGDPDSLGAQMRRQMRMMSPARMAGELVGAKVQRAVYSERQLEEVMVDFWFNHFNVFFAKGADRWLVSDYEQTAIRPHVFGRFEDLLTATATHPAMLFYLDNWRNFVPDSMNPDARRGRDMQRRRGGQRGYNENYARELLELHTLGVDGGYTQSDVVEIARALTGWTITRPDRAMASAGGSIEFRFVPELHDPGEKTVLGERLPGGRSMDDGRRVLGMLATHPASAHHIASKLVERFVSDDPPADVVDRVAEVFLSTGGDLRAVTRAVFQDPGFTDPSVFEQKIRSPFELVVASLRVTEADVGRAPQLVQQLRAFQHLPYMADVPTGYPETSDVWVNSGAMLLRMNYSLALASGSIRGVRIASEGVAAALAADSAADPSQWVSAMAVALLPGSDTDELEGIVLEDLRGQDVTGTAAMRRAAGLLIGSPEFQRH